VIRVFVVAESEVVRAGLEKLIQSSGALSLTGSAPDMDGYRNDSPVDVLLMDSLIPELDIPDTEVPQSIVLLTDATPHTGVPAVLPRSATRDQIIAAVLAVAAGLTVRHPDSAIAPPTRRDHPNAPVQPLTDREMQVLGMLSQGFANKTIAWKLGISDHTVKFHVSSIFSKLGVSSRTEAVTLGARLGLIFL
jgi:two-component system, NarL family, response regulator YdfI